MDTNTSAGRDIHALAIHDSLTIGESYTKEMLCFFDGPNQSGAILLDIRKSDDTNQHGRYPGWTWRNNCNLTPS